jgi:branched-chain amino acid transport system ATP-binding protein
MASLAATSLGSTLRWFQRDGRFSPASRSSKNLKLGATIRRDGEIGSDLEAVFAEFPVLAERRRQMAGLLSGGEQQMLAIGSALMSRPRLLMLDEPSLGLAPMALARVYDKLTVIRSRGVAILIAEQNAARAFAAADRARSS